MSFFSRTLRLLYPKDITFFEITCYETGDRPSSVQQTILASCPRTGYPLPLALFSPGIFLPG